METIVAIIALYVHYGNRYTSYLAGNVSNRKENNIEQKETEHSPFHFMSRVFYGYS